MNKFYNLLTSLANILPPALLVIAFAPLAIGLSIDPKLIELNSIVINLVWVSLFTLPYIWLKKTSHLLPTISFMQPWISTE